MSVNRSLAWLTGGRLIISTGYRFVYPFLPVIARGLGVSLQQAGLLISARSLSGAAAPILLALSKRNRRRRVIGASIVLFALGVGLTAASGLYAGAMVGFILVGISKPAFDVSAQAYLADRVPYRRRARYLAVMEVAWAGGMLVPDTALFEGDHPGHLRLPPRAVALLAVVALLGFAGDNLLVVLGAWLEDGFGLAPIALGGVVTLIAVAELAGEGSTIAFADRIGKARSVGLGLAISAVGFAALTGLSNSLVTGIGALLMALGGFEFAYVSSIQLASEAVPENRSRYLALYTVSFFVGRTIGAAVGPALFAAGGLAANAGTAAARSVRSRRIRHLEDAMPEFTHYAPGTFCWIDTGTTDAAASTAFYTALFGWETSDSPTPDGGTYTMYSKGGKAVAGGSALSDELQSMGVSSHWMSYISVEDVAVTLAKVAAAGGNPMGPPIPIPGAGIMGVFTDPTGAACAIWQPGDHIGAGLANEPGSLVWNELITTDPTAAATFYTRVFGWDHEVSEMANGPYHLFKVGEYFRAGIIATTPGMGDTPSNWSVYLSVADIDAAVAMVGELGGRIKGEVLDVEEVGRIAVTADPTGAGFMMMEAAFPE